MKNKDDNKDITETGKRRFGLDKLFLLAGLALLLFAAVYGGHAYLVDKSSEDTVDSLRTLVETEPSQETEDESESEEKAEEYISPYKKVFEQNEDMVAWLKIPGTVIDYPVMQTKEDEEYYLHRDFNGNENINGTLFAAAACDVEPPSTNILIHGHNMRSGQMFGDLDKYADQEFEQKHSQILLYTKNEDRKYSIIAAFTQKVLREDEEGFRYYRFFEAGDEEEYDEFVKQVKGMSYYNIEESAEYGEELITLSTCANRGGSRRFVVVGKRIS